MGEFTVGLGLAFCSKRWGQCLENNSSVFDDSVNRGPDTSVGYLGHLLGWLHALQGDSSYPTSQLLFTVEPSLSTHCLRQWFCTLLKEPIHLTTLSERIVKTPLLTGEFFVCDSYHAGKRRLEMKAISQPAVLTPSILVLALVAAAVVFTPHLRWVQVSAQRVRKYPCSPTSAWTSSCWSFSEWRFARKSVSDALRQQVSGHIHLRSLVMC